MKKFYHYTSFEHLCEILSDGYIKTTSSNLVRPIAPKIENNKFVDVTDSYKPVVWLTDVLDFNTAMGNGLLYQKTEVAIVVNNPLLKIYKWTEWIKDNNADMEWQKQLISECKDYEHWYVCEGKIQINDDTTPLLFRPDVYKKLKINNMIKEN